MYHSFADAITKNDLDHQAREAGLRPYTPPHKGPGASIQGQILRLILRESGERNMAGLLITHNLGVVTDVADYVGVT